jgi:diadenosine tetraphosphate (Ap4A) HIT family hydrolase
MAAERIRESCEHGFVVDDAYPVACGHTLVVSRRHKPSFFDLTPEEIAAPIGLLRSARERIDPSLRPRGYNVGINLGEAAGQTVPHVHIHLIPRYAGDSPGPRGGVRNVIPGKGIYDFSTIAEGRNG